MCCLIKLQLNCYVASRYCIIKYIKEDKPMKLNEQIREHRKKVGLTQEQVANYLGVSTPAVNKWESGVSHS